VSRLLLLRHWLRRLGPPVALALAVLAPGGCAAVAVGAVGAGAAGFAYYNGLRYREYHASLGDTTSATRAALGDLQFPVIEHTTDTGTSTLKTRTNDGHTVRIYLDVVPSPIPAEGSLTRVSIRVGVTGDEGVSARLLDQIYLHLAPPGAAAAALQPTPRPSGATLGAPQPMALQQGGAGGAASDVRPAAFETPPPPLAPPAPVAAPSDGKR
jgi:hypothetical protein